MPSKTGDRQIETLAALSEAATGLSPSQIADRIGIDVRNVHSVLGPLMERGWVRKVKGPIYVITTLGRHRVLAEGGTVSAQ